MTEPTTQDRSELHLRFSRRMMAVLLLIIVAFGAIGLAMTLRPDGAFSQALERAPWFFPIATMKGKMLLLAKAHVREILVALEDAELPDWECGTPAEVDIVMHGGARHVGTILVQLASGQRRVMDFLNRLHDRFVPLYKEDGMVLLNREQIAHVCHSA